MQKLVNQFIRLANAFDVEGTLALARNAIHWRHTGSFAAGADTIPQQHLDAAPAAAPVLSVEPLRQRLLSHAPI